MDYFFSAAVGFAAGVLSTFLMTLFEIPFWKKWCLIGILEWHENQILFGKLIKADINRINFYGIFLLHFLNGGLGGAGLFLFVDLYPVFVEHAFLLGLGYAFFLWILTLLPIHKPITGIDPFRHPLGMGPLLASLFGHIIYGLLLSMLLQVLFK